MIAADAARIRNPSTMADRYSALPCPKWCSASAGRFAARSANTATRAAPMLTVDSRASDSSPTESVRYQASVLSPSTTTPVATDSQA